MHNYTKFPVFCLTWFTVLYLFSLAENIEARQWQLEGQKGAYTPGDTVQGHLERQKQKYGILRKGQFAQLYIGLNNDWNALVDSLISVAAQT